MWQLSLENRGRWSVQHHQGGPRGTGAGPALVDCLGAGLRRGPFLESWSAHCLPPKFLLLGKEVSRELGDWKDSPAQPCADGGSQAIVLRPSPQTGWGGGLFPILTLSRPEQEGKPATAGEEAGPGAVPGGLACRGPGTGHRCGAAGRAFLQEQGGDPHRAGRPPPPTPPGTPGCDDGDQLPCHWGRRTLPDMTSALGHCAACKVAPQHQAGEDAVLVSSQAACARPGDTAL